MLIVCMCKKDGRWCQLCSKLRLVSITVIYCRCRLLVNIHWDVHRNRDTSIDNSYIPTCYTISVENKQNAGDQPELNHGWRVTMRGSLLTATCHVSRVTIRPTWHQTTRTCADQSNWLVWSGSLKYRYYKDHTHITFKWHNNGYVWLNKCLQP